MEPGHAEPPADEDGSGPFAELKTVKLFDVIALKVPAIWSCAMDEKAGMLRCGADHAAADPAADTGELWIDLDIVELDREYLLGTPEREAALKSLAGRIAGDKKRAGELGADKPDLVDSLWGKAIRYWRPVETEEGRFREHRWHVLSLVVSDLLVTHYSLVLTEATADRPAWRRLVETMDREIRAAEFAAVLAAESADVQSPAPTD